MPTPTKEEFLAALDVFQEAAYVHGFEGYDYEDAGAARQKLIDMWDQVTKEEQA